MTISQNYIVRALDSNGDWTFGASLNNYLQNGAAVVQNISTNLNSYLGDCFFAQTQGINWFGLLGAKSQAAIQIAVTTVILNTTNVVSLNQLSIDLNSQTRVLSISYSVNTTFGQQNDLLVINPTINS